MIAQLYFLVGFLVGMLFAVFAVSLLIRRARRAERRAALVARFRLAWLVSRVAIEERRSADHAVVVWQIRS